jgi:hypothetical protein
MIANQNRTPSLDDVLAEIAASPVPPDAQQLRWWMNRYPEFKAEILDFATDWIEMEAAKSPHEVTKDEVDLVVNRTMSRVQQLLDKAERHTSMKDLLADIKSAGHDFESFQRAVGIDRSMLTCLAERMIRPATIPLRLVTAMALALNRTVEVVRDPYWAQACSPKSHRANAVRCRQACCRPRRPTITRKKRSVSSMSLCRGRAITSRCHVRSDTPTRTDPIHPKR